MPDPIIDDPTTPLEGNWYDAMAGEDTGKIEILSKFDSADAFYDSHQGMVNANWRAPFITEDDPKSAIEMERFDSPLAYAKSFKEAQATISSGKLKDALPGADATEDDITAYRVANDIPLEVEGYYKDMPDGLILGEDDKPVADVFMNALHKENAPPALGHALISAYNDFKESEQDAEAELDSMQAKEATDALRETWRGDYRQNINAVETFFKREFGEEDAEQLMAGRYLDGRHFMNNPTVLEVFARVERVLNPMVALHHVGDVTQEQSAKEEEAKILKFMRTNRPEYNKDMEMQKRLRELNQFKIDQEKIKTG